MESVVIPPGLESWKGTTYGYNTYLAEHCRRPDPFFDRKELDEAIKGSREYLLGMQTSEPGHWVGELEANSSMTSEYIFLMHFMDNVDEIRQRKMVHYLKETQMADGSWSLHYGGPGDLSTTLEAYTAMRLAGTDPEAESMALARDFVLAHGGVEESRIFTKIFLALLGLYPWEQCPALPPELMLLPEGFPFNIYEISSWARSTLVPLLILWHYKPAVKASNSFTLNEIRLTGSSPEKELAPTSRAYGWERLFFLADRILKVYDKKPLPRTREKALKAAENWILARQESTGDWGGIQPAMVNSLLALKCLGYPLDHPAVSKGLEAVHRFSIEDSKTVRLQPCVSPVWDTANTCLALLESGLPRHHGAIQKAIAWLWSKQIEGSGDWAVKNHQGAPGGLSFDFDNQFFTDCDDTLAVLTALWQSGSDEKHPEAWQRGLRWLLSMQSKNGGWAAFDINNNQEIWNRIPFADHKAMLDPPTSDITGRVLEFLGRLGYGTAFAPARQAVEFLEAEQEADGAWFGRWGVNYLYGTWCALCGLEAIGYDMNSTPIRRAAAWLLSCQNEDGGWGESCSSYDDPGRKGQGKSTASQTSWALMGLCAAGEAGSEAARQGVAYLLRTQNRKGSWEEKEFTGTGFPGFFYLRYHMYADYFPLTALSRYANATGEPMV